MLVSSANLPAGKARSSRFVDPDEQGTRVKSALWLCVPALWAATTIARADPGYYVVTAYDNAGQRTVDFRYWTVKAKGRPATRWPEIGFGYGVTSRWYTELYASFIGSQDSATRLSTWNWQNEYLLTQGNLPIDIAIHAAVQKYSGASNGYSIEYGPVLQTDIGRTQLNLNVFFEHEYGDDADGSTEMKYQWQVKRRWLPHLQFGLQGFGELGPWNHWDSRDRQSHRAGPALFGSVPVGNGTTLLYQAAILLGSTYGQNGDMFSMRVQYAF
jgi:hypothetical protein